MLSLQQRPQIPRPLPTGNAPQLKNPDKWLPDAEITREQDNLKEKIQTLTYLWESVGTKLGVPDFKPQSLRFDERIVSWVKDALQDFPSSPKARLSNFNYWLQLHSYIDRLQKTSDILSSLQIAPKLAETNARFGTSIGKNPPLSLTPASQRAVFDHCKKEIDNVNYVFDALRKMRSSEQLLMAVSNAPAAILNTGTFAIAGTTIGQFERASTNGRAVLLGTAAVGFLIPPIFSNVVKILKPALSSRSTQLSQLIRAHYFEGISAGRDANNAARFHREFSDLAEAMHGPLTPEIFKEFATAAEAFLHEGINIKGGAGAAAANTADFLNGPAFDLLYSTFRQQVERASFDLGSNHSMIGSVIGAMTQHSSPVYAPMTRLASVLRVSARFNGPEGVRFLRGSAQALARQATVLEEGYFQAMRLTDSLVVPLGESIRLTPQAIGNYANHFNAFYSTIEEYCTRAAGLARVNPEIFRPYLENWKTIADSASRLAKKAEHLDGEAYRRSVSDLLGLHEDFLGVLSQLQREHVGLMATSEVMNMAVAGL